MSTTDKNRRILIIDDNESIHKDFKAILCDDGQNNDELDEAKAALFGEEESDSKPQEGFEIHSAYQGQEGLEMIKKSLEEDNPYAMAFVDVRMPPGWDGVETIQNIWEVYPELQVVICTAYSDYQWGDIVKKLGDTEQLLILKKPFDNMEVYQLASALTQKWMLALQAKTVQKELERKVGERTAELVEANDKLKGHDKLKSEFVMTVSHEMRTPLTIFKNIISNFSAGVMGKVTDKQKGSLEIADKEIDRLSRIISDFLDISKIEAGKMKLKRKYTPIQAAVDEAVELVKPLAAKNGIVVSSEQPEGKLMVYADTDRLNQVLVNLMGNAIKFINDGDTITVKVTDVDNEIKIAVVDSGPGIEKEDVGKIFNKFVQVERQAGPGAHGTGLGLAICRELVELHGGRIWAESTVGVGSEFCFALPKYSEEEAEQVENEVDSEEQEAEQKEKVEVA